MRELTDLEIQNESFLKTRGIHFAKVWMTENILSHHIFDATQSVDSFLREEGIHDFNLQNNGEKTLIFSHFLTFKKEIFIQTSLYKTKRGDKRMWFGSEILPTTSSGDVYLMIAKSRDLYILNMSHIDILFCCSTGLDNPIKEIFKNFQLNQ